MEFLHTQVIENGKVCFAEHRHFGRTIKGWEAFTEFEYGAAWAQWKLAADKRKRDGYYEARPCRRR